MKFMKCTEIGSWWRGIVTVGKIYLVDDTKAPEQFHFLLGSGDIRFSLYCKFQ